MRKKRLFCSPGSCIVVWTDESGNFQKGFMLMLMLSRAEKEYVFLIYSHFPFFGHEDLWHN